jgi:hypothetical protein
MDLSLKTLLRCVSLLRGDHLDEAKTTRLLSVRIAHDVTLLYLAVLLEETGDLFFAKSRMNSSDEEVGARVTALIVIIPTLWRRATAVATAR